LTSSIVIETTSLVLFNAFKRLASGGSTLVKSDLFASTAASFYRLSNFAR
jgi:hypothetical protein